MRFKYITIKSYIVPCYPSRPTNNISQQIIKLLVEIGLTTFYMFCTLLFNANPSNIVEDIRV
jgi:hypothetical protein